MGIMKMMIDMDFASIRTLTQPQVSVKWSDGRSVAEDSESERKARLQRTATAVLGRVNSQGVIGRMASQSLSRAPGLIGRVATQGVGFICGKLNSEKGVHQKTFSEPSPR